MGYVEGIGYDKAAASLADTLKGAVDGVHEVTLTRGSGGVFEVTVDGNLVFSKKAEGRFPEDQEAIDLVNQAV